MSEGDPDPDAEDDKPPGSSDTGGESGADGESETATHTAPDDGDGDPNDTGADGGRDAPEDDEDGDGEADDHEDTQPTVAPGSGTAPPEPATPEPVPAGIDTEGAPGDQEMPLADHIEEMMRRLAVVLVVLAIVSAIVLPLADRLINFLWYSFLPGPPTACVQTAAAIPGNITGNGTLVDVTNATLTNATSGTTLNATGGRILSAANGTLATAANGTTVSLTDAALVRTNLTGSLGNVTNATLASASNATLVNVTGGTLLDATNVSLANVTGMGPGIGANTDAACPRLYHPLALVFARLKMASLAGFVIALPVFVYETYLFMRPGLYPNERRYYLASVPTSLILAGIGLLFAYFLVLPIIFVYFLGYSQPVAEVAFGLSKTFDLIVLMLGMFALIFQIPLFVMLAIMMGVTSRRWLEDKRLYFWLGFGGIAFLFSPDPTGMAPFIVAATMIVLFEGTLLLLRWTGR